MLLAQHEISLNWSAIDDYIPSIRKVSAEDIQRVAKRYLIPDNRTVGILIPLPPKEGKPVPAESSIKERMVR
jgi:zinc protease